VNASQPWEKITETDPSSVQLSQAFAENPKNFTTRLLPTSGDSPASATTPTLADLAGLYADGSGLLTVKEIAQQLGVCAATIYRLCDRGLLPHVRILNSIRIRSGDLAALLKNAGHRRSV
jgi:excisionase family DNA binding protein